MRFLFITHIIVNRLSFVLELLYFFFFFFSILTRNVSHIPSIFLSVLFYFFSSLYKYTLPIPSYHMFPFLVACIRIRLFDRCIERDGFYRKIKDKTKQDTNSAYAKRKSLLLLQSTNSSPLNHFSFRLAVTCFYFDTLPYSHYFYWID